MAAVGSITFTEQSFSSVRRITFAWTSDASGAVSGIPTVGAFDGAIIACVTVPSGGGTAPSASYTLQILDSAGVDVLAQAGTARSATAQETLKSPLGAVAASTLSLVIAAAGNAKQGTVHLFLR
jgi:hypothetical protein